MQQAQKLNTQNKHRTNKQKKPDLEKIWNIYDNNLSQLCDIEEDKDKTNTNINFSKNPENNQCYQCSYQLILGDEGYLICSNSKCGIMCKNFLDQTAEWRFYGSEDNNSGDPTRCGMPINPLLLESSFSCKILYSHKQTYEMQKIRKYTEWQSMPYREKSQYDEFLHITNIANTAGIPKMIIDDAIRFHKKIAEARTFRGLNRDSIIAASIYLSCRANNFPRTSKEIASIFNLDNNSATKGCKNALSIINDVEYNNNIDSNVNQQKNETNMEINNEINLLNKTTPMSFMDRYCSRLNMNTEMTNLCKFIAQQIEKKNLIPENTPHSIAGGIIYFISQLCKLNINKFDINNISKISEVTINKCYKKIDDIKEQIVPKSILVKYS